MPFSTFERKLPLSLVTLLAIIILAASAVVAALFLGVRPPLSSAVAAAIVLVGLGLAALMVRRLAGRRLEEIRLGAELMATVNPEHRLPIRPGDWLAPVAEEINRMADRLGEARQGLEREVQRATQELDAERSRLAGVLETLGEGVAVATSEGRVVLANRAAHAVLGVGPGGLLGRSLFDLVDREKVIHFFDRLRTAPAGAERFSLHPPGGAILDSVMTPLFDDAHRLIGFTLVFHDVTGPARTAEARRHSLAEILHELRGPIASVRSLSESLLGEPAFARAPDRRLLEAIHAEAVRLSAVVRDMGEPSRLGLARPPWHFEEISFEDLAAIALRRLREDGVAFAEVEVIGEPSPSPRLRAEVSALSAALGHLLRSLLAQRDRRGKAWLRPRRRGRLLQIEAGAESRAGWMGLDALLDAPVPVGGTGPVSVRNIVRQHAGEVWAYGDDGRVGFRITLPDVEPWEPAVGAAGVAPGAGFIGAGTASGLAREEPDAERPDFYDFSLFDEMDRHVVATDRERPLGDVPCVVFDIETTGLRPEEGDRIVSIAGVRVRGGMVKRGETFDALVNPRRSIPSSSVKFHGITDGMVAEAPPIDVVLPAFLRFADGAVLVGHQVWFDVHFLALEAARLGLPPITLVHPVLDTLVLSELVHGVLPGHSLEAVAARLRVAVRGRHSALGDALTTADIFVRLVELLKKREIVTLGHALDATRKVHGARADDVTPGAGP